jgi:pimeloyl-ACP methyl ester carboxylesterase
MTPIVLIHGGGLDGRSWDRLIPSIAGEAIAVDLPGRGAHPAPLDAINFADCATSVVGDIDAAGYNEVVLVGHSLAGCSMPAMIGLLGRRVRHAVFVACTVPEDGSSAIDTLEPEVRAMIRDAPEPDEATAMDPALAKVVLGNDLDEEQLAWCVERLVPDAPRLSADPVDLAPLRASPAARTWVRTLQDIIVPAEKQLRFARNVERCPVVDLDAGHMCMISQPEALSHILNDIAA